jgi:3-carboxy-cis,cis-muconate cycloisomerase
MPRIMSPSAAPARVAAVQALFSRRSLWQSWLDIEATLAEVQGELGIIPAASAAEIRSKANFDAINEEALAADVDRTMAPVLSLARALSAACSPEAGGHVHWGATTQNVMQTGRTLLMRRAHRAFMERFGEVLDKLAGLAETHAETLTVARTNYRHALPVTFGFKVAGWIEEMLRHRDRFAGAEPRIFMSLWARCMPSASMAPKSTGGCQNGWGCSPCACPRAPPPTRSPNTSCCLRCSARPAPRSRAGCTR